jgi:threonine dehydrogenase-like Zn-dependent dehydrogenase
LIQRRHAYQGVEIKEQEDGRADNSLKKSEAFRRPDESDRDARNHRLIARHNGEDESGCRQGDAFACENVHEVTGITSGGGYAEYIVARADALARVPIELAGVDAAPLMCAGVTTFNALRNSGARPGDLVAVHGLGGLGHLGV